MKTALSDYNTSGSASGTLDLPAFTNIATINGIVWTGEGTLTITAKSGHVLYTQTNTNLHTSGSALYNELQPSGAPLLLPAPINYTIAGAYKGEITVFGFTE